jgi:hypothetical protein
LNSELFVGKVNYFKKQEFYSLESEMYKLKKEIKSESIGNAQIGLFLKKRKAFEFEQEIRLLQIGPVIGGEKLVVNPMESAIEVQLHPLMGKRHAAILKKFFNDRYNIRTTQSALYNEIADNPIVLKGK